MAADVSVYLGPYFRMVTLSQDRFLPRKCMNAEDLPWQTINRTQILNVLNVPFNHEIHSTEVSTENCGLCPFPFGGGQDHCFWKC